MKKRLEQNLEENPGRKSYVGLKVEMSMGQIDLGKPPKCLLNQTQLVYERSLIQCAVCAKPQ